MKKYLILSIASIVISIVLITQLYKNTDIAFVDAIVENTTSALGIKSEVVEKKVERKRLESESAKAIETNIPLPVPDDSQEVESEVVESDPIAARVKLDSISRIEKEKSMKKIFNAKIDTEALEKAKQEELLARQKAIEDSIALASKPKKKPLFNAVVENQKTINASTEAVLQYFEARVHGSQKFSDNQEVLFRTTQEIIINGKVIPTNYVFSAKANVFDGKFHFVIKKIDNIVIEGQNYINTSPGMPISPESKFNDAYIVSDGMPLKFGYKI